MNSEVHEIQNYLSDILNHDETKVLYFQDKFLQRMINDPNNYRYNEGLENTQYSEVIVWVTDSALEESIGFFNNFFSDFISNHNGGIGIGQLLRPKIFGQGDLREFVRNHLVRAAVYLTPKTVGELVVDWKNGGSISYMSKYYFKNLKVESTQSIYKNVEILPGKIDNLDNNVNYLTHEQYNLEPKLNGIIISVRNKLAPVFFKPQHKKDTFNPNSKLLQGEKFNQQFFNTLSYAFSIVFNKCIPLVVNWNFGREIAAFSELEIKHFFDTGFSSSRPVQINKSDLKLIFDINDLLIKLFEDQRFKVAVGRWYKSKHVDADDKFLEMRIALEALFLERHSRNIGEKLAKSMADKINFQGKDSAKIETEVKKFYKISSELIHAKIDAGKNRELLDLMQEYCRIGICDKICEQDSKGQKNLEIFLNKMLNKFPIGTQTPI